jgi:hypothetical protein
MLNLLTKHVRGWAAGILVVAYAFGVLTPSLAFSFDSKASIIHSLTETHGGMLMPHVHHDHADDKNSDKGSPGGGHHCCGVFALAGLLPPTDASIADQICTSLIASVPQDRHAGCGPIRLDRPPRLSPLI